MQQLTLVLLLQELIGPGIDLREEIALFDQLAFLEADVRQLAGDLGLYRHVGEGCHGAECVQYDLDVAASDGCYAHRLWAHRRRLCGSGAPAGRPAARPPDRPRSRAGRGSACPAETRRASGAPSGWRAHAASYPATPAGRGLLSEAFWVVTFFVHLRLARRMPARPLMTVRRKSHNAVAVMAPCRVLNSKRRRHRWNRRQSPQIRKDRCVPTTAECLYQADAGDKEALLHAERRLFVGEQSRLGRHDRREGGGAGLVLIQIDLDRFGAPP